jgi:heme-degrading monooxygenase HmoA
MKLQVGRRTGFMIPVPAEGDPSRTAEGVKIYARLTSMSFRVEAADEGVRLFETSVVPAARAQKGFRAAYLFSDRKTGRAVALTLWDDEASALANERNRYYQDQLVKFLPLFTAPPIREGFELEVVAEAE